MVTDINIYTLKQVRSKRRRYDLEDCNITRPAACYKVIQDILDLESEPVEKFGIIALNNRNKINGIHIIGVGTINNVNIEPREVFMAAMMNNAKSIIAFHNHPSGDPSPSTGDILMTRRLKEAGEILGIELVDHLITGNEKYISLREIGKFK
ncbi:MAG TPA: JAB domain-containing protein [Bacillota bacterium]|nr:JAB domain-containing protein [Bacillota bacterium]